MNIQMVDLKSQYLKIKNEIDEKIIKVIENTDFINGSEVKKFQIALSQYLNNSNVITCGNGTDALQIALMSLNLKEDDEVITSDFTFIATAEVISLLKLKPVLVDVDKYTFNIDVEQIEKKITEKTKVIIPVHLFGQCADMERIMNIAKKYNLFVIEDTAQSLGCDYYFSDGTVKKAGTIGHIGCTSFFPSKNLGCYGDGGAIFTDDNNLAKKMETIANHGSEIKYYHDYVGINSRLDTIQAAILNVKLKYLDSYNKSRQKVADFYNNELKYCKQIIIPKRSNFSSHIFHQYTLILNKINRDKLQKYLSLKGISTAIYYPLPIHAQKAFLKYNYKNTDFEISNYLSNNVLSLPIHSEMNEEILNLITDSCKLGLEIS